MRYKYFYLSIITLSFAWLPVNAWFSLNFLRAWTEPASPETINLVNEALGTSKNNFKVFRTSQYEPGSGYVNTFTKTIALNDNTVNRTLIPFTVYHLAGHIHNKDTEKLVGTIIGSLAFYTGIVHKIVRNTSLGKSIKKFTTPVKITAGLITATVGLGITYLLVNALRNNQEYKADIWACEKLLEKNKIESLENYLSHLQLKACSVKPEDQKMIRVWEDELNNLKNYIQQKGYIVNEHRESPKGINQSIFTILKGQ